MIPDEFKQQVAEGGLKFEAYLPPQLALWVIARIEQGDFTSPSEAAFVAMQTFQDMDCYPDVKKELLRQMIAEAEQDIAKGNTISHEEAMAALKEMTSQGKPESAVWDRSMDRPFLEE